MIFYCLQKLVCAVRKQSDLTSTLDSRRKLSLVLSTSSRYTAGKDLSSFGSISVELGNILIINAFALINAKLANLFAALLNYAALIKCHNKFPPSLEW